MDYTATLVKLVVGVAEYVLVWLMSGKTWFVALRYFHLHRRWKMMLVEIISLKHSEKKSTHKLLTGCTHWWMEGTLCSVWQDFVAIDNPVKRIAYFSKKDSCAWLQVLRFRYDDTSIAVTLYCTDRDVSKSDASLYSFSIKCLIVARQ